jgi:hypothetical protein
MDFPMPRKWGTVVPRTHLREGEAGHNELLEGTAGDTLRSKTAST